MNRPNVAQQSRKANNHSAKKKKTAEATTHPSPVFPRPPPSPPASASKMNDELIWSIVNHQFCSFKAKLSEERTFCRNHDNVTGQCDRRSCPLANSRFVVLQLDFYSSRVSSICHLGMFLSARAVGGFGFVSLFALVHVISEQAVVQNACRTLLLLKTCREGDQLTRFNSGMRLLRKKMAEPCFTSRLRVRCKSRKNWLGVSSNRAIDKISRTNKNAPTRQKSYGKRLFSRETMQKLWPLLILNSSFGPRLCFTKISSA